MGNGPQYAGGQALHAQVDLVLTNHPPKDDIISERMETISIHIRDIGHMLVNMCPESRELSLALTKLQETRMFAIAAVACHQDSIL